MGGGGVVVEIFRVPIRWGGGGVVGELFPLTAEACPKIITTKFVSARATSRESTLRDRDVGK